MYLIEQHYGKLSIFQNNGNAMTFPTFEASKQILSIS